MVHACSVVTNRNLAMAPYIAMDRYVATLIHEFERIEKQFAIEILAFAISFRQTDYSV